jgi:hypothetical protein
VHKQRKPDRAISEFQIKLAELANEITKIGTIKKLTHITNGLWLTPLECAKEAVNGAGSSEFPYSVKYRALASANNNDIELVTEQNLPKLQWQLEPQVQVQIPGSLFLHRICAQVFDTVSFFFT